MLFDNGNVGDDHMVVGAEVGSNSCKHTRTQLQVGILADDLNREGVCGSAYGGIDDVHFALEGLARIRFNSNIKFHVLVDIGEQTFRHVDEHLYGLYLLHHEDGLRHAVHVASVVVAGGHHAVDGTAEIGVLGKVVIGLFRHIERKFGHVVVGLSHGADVVKLGETGQFRRVVDILHAGLGQVDVVHAGQKLAFTHLLTDFSIDAGNTACCLRYDVVGGEGFNIGCVGVGDVDIFGLCRHNTDHWSHLGLWLFGIGVFVAFFRAASRHHGGSDNDDTEFDVFHIDVRFYSSFPMSSSKEALVTMKLYTA